MKSGLPVMLRISLSSRDTLGDVQKNYEKVLHDFSWTENYKLDTIQRNAATIAGQITSLEPPTSSCTDRSVKYALILYQLTYRGLFV